MRQIEVINLETIIDVTAETSNVEILVQDYDSELVERFALEAQEAAIDAEESADIATAQATIATTQATIATTKAGIATTQAGIATTQAGNALTSANNAAASAASAAQVGTSTPLTGFSTGANSTILATDTILQGFNKTQGQINARVSGTGASGQVAFWNGTSSQTGDNGLFWNNSTKNLGINAANPTQKLEITGNILLNGSSSRIYGPRRIVINPDLDFGINNNADNANLFFVGNNGNVRIGATTDAGFRLDVNGTARVQGVLTTTADAVVNGVNVGRGGGSIDGNTRVGSAALNANTTGSENAAFGVNALLLNTTATNNTGIGGSALQNNTTGGGNTAIGRSAGRFIADGTTANTISSSSVFIGFDSRANASSQTNQIVIGSPSIGLGSNTTVIGNSSTTFGRWFGNLLVGSSTNSGQQLQVTGTSLLNGLSTIQGTTASDSGQLGAELLTTGTGDASWTGTSFATGYTHVAGSTTTLTSTLAGVVNTFYQITYTVTGRTAGSFVIDFGGFTSSALTATGAVGPRATTTGTLVITPTSDFNGTIVLSIRVITPSSASVTFNNSAGSATNHIRISNSLTNTIIGRDSGQRNTTGTNNSFYGQAAGDSNTTGGSNSFFGLSSGGANTTGSLNAFFGTSAGGGNTTGAANSFFGHNSGVSISAGSNNVIIGQNAARFAGSGTTAMTSLFNSIYLGFQTRGLNATGSTNEVVIGYDVVGLGSNTTVLGNTSTTHGRWYGSLLLGTTTNAASSILTMESTTQGFLPPRMTTTQRNAIASPATGLMIYNTTDNLVQAYNGTSWINL